MKRSLKSIASLVMLLVLVASAAPVSATSSSGLSITPRKNLLINPGQTVTDKLTIGNLNNNADLDVTLKVIDFTYMNNSGTPKLLLANNAAPTSWSLKPFLILPKSIVVPAGQSRTVSYSVKIPASQGAGSYYSAIQYGSSSPSGGNVSLSASGVSLVFVSVPGVVRESMTLQQLGAYQADADGITGRYVSIATNPPTQLAYTLTNAGNVAESPVSSMTLKYMFGGKNWSIANANETASLALIGQSRLFQSCIVAVPKAVNLGGTTTQTKVCQKVSFWPGRYTINLDTFYGQNGNNTHEVTGVAHFWYLPVWFLITFAVLLAALVIGILLIVRKLRRATQPGNRRITR